MLSLCRSRRVIPIRETISGGHGRSQTMLSYQSSTVLFCSVGGRTSNILSIARLKGTSPSPSPRIAHKQTMIDHHDDDDEDEEDPSRILAFSHRQNRRERRARIACYMYSSLLYSSLLFYWFYCTLCL